MQTMIRTQADRLAQLYSDVHRGKTIPAEMEHRALSDEIREIESDELPKLACTVDTKEKQIAELVASMPAAIFGNNKLFYFEIAATASPTAHAFAGAIAEHRLDAAWRFKWDEISPNWIDVEIPEGCQIRDTRLAVPGWSKILHHVAVLSRSNDLVIADNDDVLYSKLRARMSCPTLPEWGPELMPRIHRTGLLMPTKTCGIPATLKTYVLAADASALFDKIVSEFVRGKGGL